jgi:hypothetical protein
VVNRGIGLDAIRRRQNFLEAEEMYLITYLYQSLTQRSKDLATPDVLGIHVQHKDASRNQPCLCRMSMARSSLPYTFFLLNGDMELNKNRQIFVNKMF